MTKMYPLALSIMLFTVLASASTVNAASTDSEQAGNEKRRLYENQRNIIRLRKEQLLLEQEIQKAQTSMAELTEDNTEAVKLKDQVRINQEYIALIDDVIPNITQFISEQKQGISLLEKGTNPSALDTALSKALNSNLPELLKNLSTNELARKEVIRLRSILKQQSLLRGKTPRTESTVSLANDEFIAEGEFLRLLGLFSGGDADEAEDKLVRITGTRNDKPYMQEEILSYLGHNHYYIEMIVHSGDMTFSIDGRPWQLNVAETEDDAPYILIYDTTKTNDPRLVMFNKSLLAD